MNDHARLVRRVVTGSLAFIVGCAPVGPTAPTVPIPELAGRTAGAPQRCIHVNQMEALRLAGSQTALYGAGRTVWVNHFGSNCAGMDRSYTLIIEPIGSQYCRGDLVRSIEPVSRVPGPACVLADFVPYTR